MQAKLLSKIEAEFRVIGDYYAEIRLTGKVEFSDGMVCGFDYRRQSFMADPRGRDHPRYPGMELLSFKRKKVWRARGVRKHAFIQFIMRNKVVDHAWD